MRTVVYRERCPLRYGPCRREVRKLGSRKFRLANAINECYTSNSVQYQLHLEETAEKKRKLSNVMHETFGQEDTQAKEPHDIEHKGDHHRLVSLSQTPSPLCDE